MFEMIEDVSHLRGKIMLLVLWMFGAIMLLVLWMLDEVTVSTLWMFYKSCVYAW